jgi:hypothetical protein
MLAVAVSVPDPPGWVIVWELGFGGNEIGGFTFAQLPAKLQANSSMLPVAGGIVPVAALGPTSG